MTVGSMQGGQLLQEAWDAAQTVASHSGVTVRPLGTVSDLGELASLCAGVWGSEAPVKAEMLRALAHAGNYVAGAFTEAGELVGGCVGFFGSPAARVLHSHLAAVKSTWRSAHVGAALKLHQRAWALNAGVDSITWTFDPLVRRNAYFNVCKLAADLEGYIPDFYGNMDDGLNRGGASDRLLVRWSLAAPKVGSASSSILSESTGGGSALLPAATPSCVLVALSPSGTPHLDVAWSTGSEAYRRSFGLVIVMIPGDIEAMRKSDPGLADEWRVVLRQALGELLGSGWSVRGFDKGGRYLCVPPTSRQ